MRYVSYILILVGINFLRSEVGTTPFVAGVILVGYGIYRLIRYCYYDK